MRRGRRILSGGRGNSEKTSPACIFSLAIGVKYPYIITISKGADAGASPGTRGRRIDMTYQITTLTDIIEYYKPIADKIEKVFAETEPEGFFSHAELRAATLGALAKKFLGEFVDCREGDDPRVDWKATH